MHLLLRCPVSGRCIVTGKRGQILTETMPGREPIVPRLSKIIQGSPAIPASHLLARSRQSRALPERLEQRILIQPAIKRMITIELLARRSVQQLYFSIAELGKGGID